MFSIVNDVIKISKGDSSGVFLASLENADGEPYELKSGDVLKLRVKKHTRDEEVLIELTADQDMQFEFKPQDTEDLATGLYKYQLNLRCATDDVFRPIAVNNFIIEEVV